jgi:hypothetical protein
MKSNVKLNVKLYVAQLAPRLVPDQSTAEGTNKLGP